MGEPINLVLASDRKGVLGLVVTGRSALEHVSRQCDIYVLAERLGEAVRQKVVDSWQTSRTGEIHFINVDRAKLRGFRTMMNLRSKTAYARLFVGELLPECTRCLYLDIDLLIMDDLNNIYDIPLHGKTIAAVLDISHDQEEAQAYRHVELGLSNSRRYFNSGLMLIDLDHWRCRQIGPRTVIYSLDNYDLLRALDQDALNVILEDDWIELDRRWNVSQYAAHREPDPAVVHLIGRAKPWHADYNYRFGDDFFHVLDQTAYKGKRPSHFGRIGVFGRQVARKIPTLEMVTGKLRRAMHQRFGTPARIGANKRR